MIGFKEQKELFDLVGRECGRKLEAFIIGGSAMLFYNFSKTVTKDIDVVLLSEKDRRYLVGVLEKIGFDIKTIPKREGEPYRLFLEEYILDIFAGGVFKMKMSEGVMDRIKEKVDFGNLTVSVISPEDIILSKSMTDRVGDREDAVSILKEINVKWDVVIDECIWQSKNGDFRFCVYLYDFLDDLVHEFNVKLPQHVVRRIKKLYRDLLDELDTKRK